MTTSGSFTEYPIPTPASAPEGIAAGSDGALWFTEGSSLANNIGRITTSGTLTEYPIPTASSQPEGIAAGPDGALWFTEAAGNNIGRITTSGSFSEFPIPTASSGAGWIATGPDGALWFTEFSSNKIGRITTSGSFSEYSIPTSSSGPQMITAGPDGALWFTELFGNQIGRITTSGSITEFPIPSSSPNPFGIAAGPDGAMWFTEETGNNIGRITAGPGAPASLTLSPSTATTTVGNQDCVTATVTDASANPTPNITVPFSVTGANVATGSGVTDSNGQTQFCYSGTAAGDDSIFAYADTNNDGIQDNGEPGGTASNTWVTEPTITSTASASTGMRTPFDFTVTTTGSPTPSISESGTLPSGITFTDNGDGTADLAGEAAAGTAGAYPLSITASNGVGTPANQSFVLTVTTATSSPTITSASSDTETFGVPFSFTVTTDGYPAPKLTKTGALPPGVTFTNNGDGTATIAGTPSMSAVGAYPLTIKAKSTAGTTTQAFTLTITMAPVIKPITTKTAHVGAAFSMTATASGSPTPALTESGTLPNGLTFTDNGDGTATIAGTPAVGSGGSYSITVTATNTLGTTSKTFTLKVDEAPAITSAATANATVGSPFLFQITDTGFPDPTISKTNALPRGITFQAGAETFSGTPRPGTAGSYPITITAKNSSGTVTQSFVLTVS